MKSRNKRLLLEVAGAVQGVGFRPFVYRLATELGLCGSVWNAPGGVRIDVEGEGEALRLFREKLESEAPPHSRIQSISGVSAPLAGARDFGIGESENGLQSVGEVLPDLATCGECLAEIFDPGNRRFLYPFTNCTHCGPRYSIVQGLPYDRANTTMRGFPMCPACLTEYRDPANRRFHAQPNACADCGPGVWFKETRGSGAIEAAAAAIRDGKIIAVKGIGGFHLLCDARNEEAVERLRQRKHRPDKPLAVLFPDFENLSTHCEVNEAERDLLHCSAAPIVLLRKSVPPSLGPSVPPSIHYSTTPPLRTEDCAYHSVPACPGSSLARNLAPENPWLGAFLPYAPLHHILLRRLGFPVVATSGNRSDEPICIDNEEARRRLGDIADGFLLHDRPIQRPVDDSVAAVVAGRAMILRRSRGYAPAALEVGLLPHRGLCGPLEVAGDLPGILALGADLKNTVAVSSGRRIFLSQHHGDLENPVALDAFLAQARDLPRLCQVEVKALACDLHPDFHSTRYAVESGQPVIRVQHHHAHIAACLAENGIDEEVLGVVWDGTGYGTDGTIWGGEFLIATQATFRRFASLRPFPLPGGERAIREPRLAAFGLLNEAGIEIGDTPLADAFDAPELKIIRQMLQKQINSPRTTSAGRLFDGAAALLGLRHRVSFEGQAAMALEFLLPAEASPFPAYSPGEAAGDWRPLLREMLGEIASGVSSATIAARFHNTLVEMILAVAREAAREKVALSGGCFQNRYLLEETIRRLRSAGFSPIWPCRVPPNDGGIAFGQAVVAASRLAALDLRL